MALSKEIANAYQRGFINFNDARMYSEANSDNKFIKSKFTDYWFLLDSSVVCIDVEKKTVKGFTREEAASK